MLDILSDPIIAFYSLPAVLSGQYCFLGRIAKLSSNILAEFGPSVLAAWLLCSAILSPDILRVVCQMSSVVLSKYLQSVLVCLRDLLELPDVSQVLFECFQLV